jgi:hypothetical protein
MVSACLTAYRLTADDQWRKGAPCIPVVSCRNDLAVPIYDPTTGGLPMGFTQTALTRIWCESIWLLLCGRSLGAEAAGGGSNLRATKR